MNKIIYLIFIFCTSLLMQSNSLFAYTPKEGMNIPIMYYVLKGEQKQFPLNSYKADVDIVGNIANVKLTQTFVNVSGQKVDAKYRFPGSTQAAVNGMTMKIKDRVIYAQIQEKQQARETFETAKKEGKRASLLSQEKPNIFTTEVANIYSGDTIQVIVEYSEIIEYKDYTYSFVLPTNIGERYQNHYENIGNRSGYDIFSNGATSKKIDFDINISISSIFDVEKVRCNTHTISAEQIDNKTFVRMNTPTQLDRDFILQYEMVSKKVESGLLIHEGEEENFFLLMLQAPKRVPAEEILPREYVFVVDVSGSMNGKPIETAIHLLGNLLEKTNEKDMFNIIKFAGSKEVLFDESKPASVENLQKGFDFLSNERGGGGTELLPALQKAMDLPKLDKYSRSVVLITDGFIDADLDVIEYLSENLDKGNVFPFGIGNSVNRYLIEGLANVSMSEPFIITNMEDADKEADRFKKYIESPVMTDIKIDFDGFDAYDIVPEKIPDVFAQRPIIISGKYRGTPEGTVYVNGQNGKQEMKTYFEVERFAQKDTSQVLKYLWARRKLQTIQDFPNTRYYGNKAKFKNANKDEIVELGLKYHLMTNHTSFVAVDTEVVDDSLSNQNYNPSADKDLYAPIQKIQISKMPSSSSGSGLNIRGARQADTQILVEGMDLSNKFTGGMGIGTKESVVSCISFEIGAKDTEMQSYPVKAGKLAENVIEEIEVDVDHPIERGLKGFIDNPTLLENILAKHLGRSSFEWEQYHIYFVIDQNKEFISIDVPIERFVDADDTDALINDLIAEIYKHMENAEANTIYSANIKVQPSGIFAVNGKEYQSEFIDSWFWREKKDVEMIEDGSSYTLYFEIWNANGKLLVKGTMEELLNGTNPLIKAVVGDLKIPKNDFCMHYVQTGKDELHLGNVTLAERTYYYINIKGVMAEAGN